MFTMSAFLSLLSLSSLFLFAISHSCGGPEVANSGSNYLELSSQAGSATFNFDATLSGNGGNICVDLGVCTANVNGATSSLYISYRSTNTGHWTADLAIAFYGTRQSFGGCCSTSGSCAANTVIGSFPGQYNTYVNYVVQVNSGFSPALASGFTAICIANTCGGGSCGDTNRFYGTFVISNLYCSAAPVNTGHPIVVPIQAPTPPTVNPTTASPSFGPTSKPTITPTAVSVVPSKVPSRPPAFWPTRMPIEPPTFRPTRAPTKKPTKVPSTIVPTQPSAEPSVNPSSEPTSPPTGPSSDPSTSPSNPTARPSPRTTNYPTRDPSFEPTFYPTYDPTIAELVGERK